MDIFKIKTRSRSPTRASGNESLRRKGDGDTVVRLDAAALIGAQQQQQQQQQPLQREVSRSTNANADGNGSAPVNLLDEKQMGGQGVQLVEFSFPSLLSPPNPAFSTSEARGILINARRASSKDRSDLSRTDQAVLSDKTNTSSASSSGATAGRASGLSQSRPHLRGSASADSISLSRTNSNQAQNQDSAAEAPRIRFAPLPDPRRPRRYSTGRDIWLDDDPDNVHINTRDGPDVDTEGWSDGPGPSGSPPMNIPGSAHSTDGETSSPVSPFGSSFGSIGHKRGTSTSSSITSKLLNPLKLGKSKSKDLNRTSSIESTNNSISPSSASYASVSQWLTGGEPLGRRISTGTVGDMPASERQRVDDLRPAGAPLSKSLSTDAADSIPRPRKAYPSVAQGGNRRRAPRYGKKAEEPEFVEWSHSSGLIGAAAEEDDGSGVAWLKKRKEERARKAKEEAEAAAKTDAAEASSSTKPAEADMQKDKTAEHGNAAVPALQVEPSTAVVERFDRRSSPDELQLEEEEEEVQNQNESVAVSQPHKPASVATVSTTEGEDGEEGDSDEEDDGNEQSDDEDGEDLTAEELEEEERLAEEARRTTEGAGREVFHSHEHVAATYQVDTRSQRKGTSDGTPAPSTEVSRRGSPLPSRNPSRQASLATTS